MKAIIRVLISNKWQQSLNSYQDNPFPFHFNLLLLRLLLFQTCWPLSPFVTIFWPSGGLPRLQASCYPLSPSLKTLFPAVSFNYNPAAPVFFPYNPLALCLPALRPCWLLSPSSTSISLRPFHGSLVVYSVFGVTPTRHSTSKLDSSPSCIMEPSTLTYCLIRLRFFP